MPWKETQKMDQRTEFALRGITCENFRALRREYGISAKTGYKWRKRFLERGYRRAGRIEPVPERAGLTERGRIQSPWTPNQRPLSFLRYLGISLFPARRPLKTQPFPETR